MLYLKQNKAGTRTYLIIAHGYRDKETKKVRTKTIKKIGYLDDLQKEYPDPIAHFKEIARKMTAEEKNQRKVTLNIDMNEKLDIDEDNRKNLGYAAILKIYHELKLDQFFNNIARHHEFKYSTNSIMTMLVVSRLLSPGSKLKAFKEKGRYFERFDFSLVDMYRSLSHFATLELEVQRHINEQITAFYGPRDTKTVYYDVTNYYFEIDQEDELRRFGLSKEHRKDPIVQMGLAMDADGIPLHYELFPGSTPDKSTFRSVIGEVRRKYNTGRIVVVGDMGVVTGDNIYYLVGGEKRQKALNGYVLSFSVRGGAEKFKKYVLDMSEYRGNDGNPVEEGADFMIKSRLEAREINVTMTDGKIKKKTVYEKQVVFWSKKYAVKAKADREKIIIKANAIVNEPGKYRKSTARGASKYIKNIEFDKETGEVITTGKALIFDKKKLLEEEKYDGYYSIVTSELHMSDEEIIETYRGLWEIEETFRITKGTLEARPVYVSRHDRINAHFLTCFISLTIMRLLQKRTDRRFSSDEIVDTLNRISCTHEQENIYLFDYYDEVSDVIGKALGIGFGMKRLRLGEIRGIVGDAKK
ncbi:MAG: IS1634 family transposase [Oscillospiraceae bacterium]|jgi:transposase|nr:IS1634 family transposase [Oscillospiraceae bacterium]